MFDIEEFGRIAPQWAQRLRYHSELGSTNDEALRLCEAGVAHGTVVLADHQTSGRGRRGAAWMSQSGAGLLFTLILRPQFEKQHWPRLALAAGCAIAQVLQELCGLPAEVKWPNDVLIDGKKCCGILVETRGDFAVVGIGINITASPDGEESVALADLTPRAVSREALLRALLDRLSQSTLVCADHFPELIDQVAEMCYLTGKTIGFSANGESLSGRALGISEEGELLVEIDGYVRRFMQAELVRVIS